MRLSLGTKLIVAFVISAIITLAIGIFGVHNLRNISQRGEEAYINNTVAISALAQAQKGLLLHARAVVRAMARSDEPERKLEEIQLAAQYWNVAGDGWKKYAATEASADETRMRAAYEAALQEYSTLSSRALELLKQDDKAGAAAIINGALLGQTRLLDKSLDDIIHVNDEQAAQANDNNRAQVTSVLTVTTLVIAVAFLFAVAGGFFLSGSIARPIHRAITAAKRIASNDLTEILRVEGSDEVAQLMQSLSDMQQGLRATLQGIAASSNQLAAASEELHAVTEDTSRSLTSQNDQLQMAATAVTEMSAAVDEVARSANDTSLSSGAAEHTVAEGRKQVGNTRAAIEDLAQRVGSTSDSMRALAQQIVDITSVLDVIGSIAEQTNLLALNAAIEAARAGEQGRGFSVVADEVRALAGRTQDSTREIAQMIDKVKSASHLAAESMAESNEKALYTRDLADAADGALEQIATAIMRINEMNLTIASASEQQAATAREVDKNLVAIRDIADQNATGALQTNASSNELARIATELNGMVNQFKL